MIIALIGNQNCGKTTLFNALTGSNQHVGNFPGVTVEKKEGSIKGNADMILVDLPGLYSLSTYTSEETVARDFLLLEKPDCVINIVDATGIERSLYLTLQLFEAQIPTVLALNRMDAAKSAGIEIDASALSQALGVPVVPVTASQNEGTPALIRAVRDTVQKHRLPIVPRFDEPVQKALDDIADIVKTDAQNSCMPLRFCASKLFDSDPSMVFPFTLTKKQTDAIAQAVQAATSDGDSYAALADARYQFIERLCAKCVKKPKTISKEERISEQIDRLLTGKYTAFPMFFVIMALVFFFTFVFPGGTLSSLFTTAINAFIALSDRLLTSLHVAPTLHSLIIGGIFTGIGSILSFLPTIVTLFFFLSLLEDTGYMARVAFIMDKPMRSLGLSGKTFVPLLIGFGCSVPAVMAARTVGSETERRKAIALVPFISCSAKLPIYVLFTGVFFPKNPLPVILSLYFGGIAVGILVMLILKGNDKTEKPESFVMELPTYRLPTARNTLTLMAEKAKDFIVKAFTVIFLSTVILWFLQNFGFSMTLVSDTSDSILAHIGRLVAPVFVPLGFGNWKTVTALITGLTAKEAVISSLKILTESALPFEEALHAEFSSLASVLSFLTFALLYMPCVAAAAAIGRELASFWATAKRMLFQTAVAWVCAWVVYRIACLFIS